MLPRAWCFMKNFVDNSGFVVVNVAMHFQIASNSTFEISGFDGLFGGSFCWRGHRRGGVRSGLCWGRV